MKKNEMYFSVDVETDGPVPGLHSMLSIGVVALHPETLEEVDTFYATLEPLPGAQQDRSTMEWWCGFPQQYAEATYGQCLPETVMLGLDAWVRLTVHKYGQKPDAEPATPIFVAYPASFDFMFYAYYAHRFVGSSVFGFSALDMGSLAMGKRGRGFSDQSKAKWPDTWVKPQDRVAIHNALADARQQADIFRRMMKPEPITWVDPDLSLRWFGGRAEQQFAFSARVLEQRDALRSLLRKIVDDDRPLRHGDLMGAHLLGAVRDAIRDAEEQPTEHVTMAAIRCPDGHVFVVPRPGRHDYVFYVMLKLGAPYSGPQFQKDCEQGFVTDMGRFVDRTEAMTIAKASGQLLDRAGHGSELFSEDIW